MKATREEVYGAIDGERAYQDMRMVRDGSTATDEQPHSPEEFLLYIEHYVHLAREKASTVWGPDAKRQVLDIIRKIAGLSVACMEANGVVLRDGYNEAGHAEEPWVAAITKAMPEDIGVFSFDNDIDRGGRIIRTPRHLSLSEAVNISTAYEPYRQAGTFLAFECLRF